MEFKNFQSFECNKFIFFSQNVTVFLAPQSSFEGKNGSLIYVVITVFNLIVDICRYYIYIYIYIYTKKYINACILGKMYVIHLIEEH